MHYPFTYEQAVKNLGGGNPAKAAKVMGFRDPSHMRNIFKQNLVGTKVLMRTAANTKKRITVGNIGASITVTLAGLGKLLELNNKSEIGKTIGIFPTSLSNIQKKLINGGSCRIEVIQKLCKYFNIKVVL